MYNLQINVPCKPEAVLPWYDLAITTREKLSRKEISGIKLRVSNVLECDAVQFLTKVPSLRIEFEVHAAFFVNLGQDALGYKLGHEWGQGVLSKISEYCKTSKDSFVTTV